MEVESSCSNRSKDAEADPGDMLSDFPDEILCHIMSFLPARDAVKTSILSPRWKDVYRGVPNIESTIESILLVNGIMDSIASLRVRMRELIADIKDIQVDLDKLARLNENMALRRDKKKKTTMMMTMMMITMMMMVMIMMRRSGVCRGLMCLES